MTKFIFTFRKTKQDIKTYIYLDGPEEAQDYISELYLNGIMLEYTLKYLNDSDGITLYENKNYILLNLPMPLTDELSEITYETGPYIIQKEMSIATYNMRSQKQSSKLNITDLFLKNSYKLNLKSILVNNNIINKFFTEQRNFYRYTQL